MRRISPSTKAFFFMFARHMCSGRPVVADWARTNWSGVCEPSPIGRSAFMYSSPALPTRGDEVIDGEVAQRVTSPLCTVHVALDHAAIGAADLRDRLAGREMQHLIDVHA